MRPCLLEKISIAGEVHILLPASKIFSSHLWYWCSTYRTIFYPSDLSLQQNVFTNLTVRICDDWNHDLEKKFLDFTKIMVQYMNQNFYPLKVENTYHWAQGCLLFARMTTPTGHIGESELELDDHRLIDKCILLKQQH